VRMRQHEANARAVAAFLSRHAKVQETIYPGLPSHPQHALAAAQMEGFGGIVTFRMPGGREQVARLLKGLRLFLFAESLGGVESLVCHPATMSHASMSAAEREALGITEGTLRLSIGIEDEEDLVSDLNEALANC
jgi:cystathionine beta-lyase/cystathionine gamma-synthase